MIEDCQLLFLQLMAFIPSPLEQMNHPLFEEKKIEVWIKRDDLIHPHIMGNKWRKLKYNLIEAKKQNKAGLLTFGGAYSNHIAATAACAAENGLQSIGIIRGDELHENSNPTLKFARSQGMELRFVNRSDFRQYKEDIKSYETQFPGYYILPEGGTNHLAIDGAEEIISEINQPFDYIFTAYGTGGTMAGLVRGASGKGKVIGVSSLKGAFVHDSFKALQIQNHIANRNYILLDNYHFGGYGKTTPTLIDFINQIKKDLSIPLDPIYTGKMFFAFWDLLIRDFFIKDAKIIILHTGGLQGIAGYNEKQPENVLH